jgi:ubiquinone/menaquinone biosynthesis C-methylase UbiE
MTEAIAARVRRYILDGSDQDLRRLVSISQASAQMARDAFRRLGVQEGWSAIDCGCGPLGGLAVLAELVGPTGRVVGVDINEGAVQRARAVTSALDLGNVEVVAGDLHTLASAALADPFNLAYTRLFLMHQPDPVATFRCIADLLRPGGWLVAQEALASPPPRAHPHLDALTGYWNLIGELLQRTGVPPDTVENLPQSAREAGLEVVAINGCFRAMDAHLGFDIHAGTLAAARERAIQLGVSAEEVDDLTRQLDAVKVGDYQWVSSPFFLDLLLRKPAPGTTPGRM